MNEQWKVITENYCFHFRGMRLAATRHVLNNEYKISNIVNSIFYNKSATATVTMPFSARVGDDWTHYY